MMCFFLPAAETNYKNILLYIEYYLYTITIDILLVMNEKLNCKKIIVCILYTYYVFC